MTKTVFANDMVAHVWAQMTQDHGRSHNGNFSFSGNTLYSYRTAIAKIYRTPSGPVILLTCERYSVTTNGKHKNAVWRATNYGRSMPIFEVPFIGAWDRKTDVDRNAANLAHFVAKYAEQVASLKRKRDLRAAPAKILAKTAAIATSYASAFNIAAPAFNVDGDATAILAHHAARNARNADPAYQAKRERDKARREARQAEKERIEALARFEREAELRAKWLDGGSVWGARLTSSNGGALLRVKGETLETSLGASVPLAHAVKVFRFVKLCRDNGTEWCRNGHTIRVGHFQVDRIRPNGDFNAGCHFIEWTECERVARLIGIFDAAPTDEALETSAA